MNSDIDEILQKAAKKDVDISLKIEKTIEDALCNKKKHSKPNFLLYFGRLIAVITSALTVAAGGIGAFAIARSEKLEGSPL